jgi:SAM-dependent methyltransferase
MKLAVYTPTHTPERLKVALRSIERNLVLTGKEAPTLDVQWHVLLNGKATRAQLPAEFEQAMGPWAVIHDDYRGPAGNVGALKAHVCEKAIAAGATHLVELDHDDELAPDCLLELEREFHATKADFLCSETATMTKFGAEFGWKTESCLVDGHRLWVNRLPEICSRSLFEIFTAPNHVRAWSTKAYAKAGGYDATLPVADDHDLLCRTYISGADMRIVRRPLYIQAEGPEQTQVTRNAEIQVAQANVGTRHLYALAQEEARRRGLQCIDLGGAHNCPKGFVGVDVAGADINCDVTEGLPFETDSVGVVRAHDFLEHIPAGASLVRLMNEIYRVLAPGGWLLTSTPSTDGRGAWQDPTHVSGWNSNSWWYYTRAEQAQFVRGLDCRFQLARVVDHFPSKWHELHRIAYCDAALVALKGQPQIGQVFI